MRPALPEWLSGHAAAERGTTAVLGAHGGLPGPKRLSLGERIGTDGG